MSALARSRAAQRGARTRVARAARRGQKTPRSTEEVDAERDARGQQTVQGARGGLPARGRVRRLHTHVEAVTGALLVATEDESVFGALITRPLAVGDPVEVRPRAGATVRRGTIAEVVPLNRNFDYVAIGVRW